MTGNSSLKQLTLARRRIILLTIFAILFTGIAVGLSSSLPMYSSVKSHIEQANLTGAQSHTSAIENQLARYKSLATQFTSRTEIRKKLEAYMDHKVSLEEVRGFSQPRLEEPASHIHDLALMVRVDAFHTIIAATGDLAARVDELDLTESDLKTVNLNNDENEIYIRVNAPILSDKGEVVGLDILYFYPESIAALLEGFGTFGKKSNLYLANQNHQRALTFDHETNILAGIALCPEVFELLQRPHKSPIISTYKKEGLDLVIVNIPLKNPEWSLTVAVPQRLFYAAAYQDLQWSFVTILGLLFLGLIISHYSVNPLVQRLVRQAAKIEKNSMELTLAASVFKEIKEPIIISNNQLAISRVNKGFVDFTGTGPKELLGKSMLDMMLTDPSDEVQVAPGQIKENILSCDSWAGEVWYKFKSSIVPILQTSTAVKNDKGDTIYYIHLLKDISKQKSFEKHISNLANNDALTGLPNRRSVYESLQQIICEHEPQASMFALMFIDLDKFKPVNDTYGHHIGDLLLKQVAERIKSSVRHADVVGRLGGDEFLLIATSLTKSIHAQRLAQKIIDYLGEPFEIEGLTLNIGASIGIAYYPEHGATPEVLIDIADKAMYQAKETGRNRFYEAKS